MEAVSGDLFNILKLLLPGFLAAWVFHAFTAYPKPSQFERVIQALIFTVFVQASLFAIEPLLKLAGKIYSFGPWDADVKTFWSYISAVAIGVTFSTLANNDKFHSLMRMVKVTKQTSYHSEWFGTFNNNITHVILHLTDDRRVFGWPEEWPADPEKGQFILRNPSWVTEKGYEDMPTVKFIMFKASDIKWVEFMQDNPEVIYVEKNPNPPTIQNSGT
ncbi:DUF6338 family protein [Cronobacter sakazakii]|uniref:DUF6338 family protein n=1 Tax=Cronobacter sakazakii TaxID=28141 RepID=UPI002893ECCE|nr:DUF6338 family protein [Cronobacter sakazakii]MDT3545828.1 DUF6338 family protein [Cronobacter sakazakii]